MSQRRSGLRIGGHVERLLETVDTPFFLLDIDVIAERYERFRTAWRRKFPRFEIAYSYKTNPLECVTQRLRALGSGASVATSHEFTLALKDGHSGSGICLNGPGKNLADIERAADKRVRLVFDSIEEILLALTIPTSRLRRASILLRVAHRRADGQLSRFGFSPRELQGAMRALRGAGICIDGLGFHVGTSASGPILHAAAASVCLDPLLRIMDAGAQFPVLSVGGGFPCELPAASRVSPPSDYAEAISYVLSKAGIGGRDVLLIAEPGRYLVEPAACLVTRVVGTKRRSSRRLVTVDAGTNLLRSGVRQGEGVARIKDMPATRFERVDVYGCRCFEGDLMGRGVEMPVGIKAGDMVAFTAVGAYDLATAFAWGQPSIPVLAVNGGGLQEVNRISVTRSARRTRA